VGQQSGVLVAFAAEPGKTASDTGQGSGAYAAALAAELVKPGQSDLIMFHHVRVAVMEKTSGDQVPWTEDGLQRRERVLFGGEAKPSTAVVTPTLTRLSEAAEVWSPTKDATSTAVLDAFIARYKDTFFAELARARIDELKKQQMAVMVPPKAPAPTPQTKPAMTTPPAPPSSRCDGVDTQVGSGKRWEKRCLKPKDSFKDCPTCPKMVVVLAGEFMMGSEEYSDEKPVHQVTIAKPFAVGKFEVTFDEWDECVSGGGCKHKPDDLIWERGSRPVMNVSWDDITKDYLPWLSRKTVNSYRLLTEAEWEYAARSGSRSKYSWGDEIGMNRANCNGCGSQWDNKQTAPVGSFSGKCLRPTRHA
jgi:formylglycine-generating enzyme required for sulfatase activity